MSRDDRARPSAEPQSLSDALARFVDGRGWHERLRDSAVHTRWIDIAGDELAHHVTPVRLRGGVLVVRAESGAWAAQLRYLSPWLLQRAQEVLGAERVNRVQIISGAQEPGSDTGSAER